MTNNVFGGTLNLAQFKFQDSKVNSCHIMQQDNCSVFIHPDLQTVTSYSRSLEIGKFAFC